jgi:hypothetical protein
MQNPPKPPAHFNKDTESVSSSCLAARADHFITETLRELDLGLLNAAREVYQRYLLAHESRAKEPIGIVVHRHTHQSKLLFRSAPVLLPEECFVSLQQVRGR